MSEFTELILDGVVCQFCGEYLDDIANDVDTPGYPRSCTTCEERWEELGE